MGRARTAEAVHRLPAANQPLRDPVRRARPPWSVTHSCDVPQCLASDLGRDAEQAASTSSTSTFAASQPGSSSGANRGHNAFVRIGSRQLITPRPPSALYPLLEVILHSPRCLRASGHVARAVAPARVLLAWPIPPEFGFCGAWLGAVGDGDNDGVAVGPSTLTTPHAPRPQEQVTSQTATGLLDHLIRPLQERRRDGQA
jgi:hypothetical protein